MPSALWQAAKGERQIGPIAGTLLRIVESQEQVATARLVDGLDKQALLEELLESSKPPLRPGTERLHYLLATPFRYPPLRHGSRFGRRYEPSLMYGSLGLPALLADAAYCRLLFWDGMATPPPIRLTSQHAVFEVRYASPRGLRLHQPPFDAWRAELRDASDYRASQALGTAMRAADVAVFEFVSARDPAQGINVALFHPEALADTRPSYTEHWLAETTASQVRFHSQGAGQFLHFQRAQFTVEGQLPLPAS